MKTTEYTNRIVLNTDVDIAYYQPTKLKATHPFQRTVDS